MPDYDFKTLSPYEFELLVRDLLQEELGVMLESFKSGRDKGIDLRYSPSREEKLVVQCKHYAGSGYQILFSHLQREEATKVKALQPTRYLLATSVGLTPGNKEDIKSLFDPYCSSTGDVYGREDLNNLLGRHPQVERKYFKLWLTSTAILQRVLQSSVFNRSEVEAEAIKRKLKYFVTTESLARAKGILEESHYCLITGIPGIGKTTLAEILIVDYIADGYEAIRVTSDIAEAYATYRPSNKQIFYYDDFLGQAGLEEKLSKNEDQNILRFIEAVRHSSNTRLIFTTRDYILKQAEATYERLGAANLDTKKFVLELSDFTELQKAEILYNHVYFSDLPEEHKADLLQDKNYLKIIRHRNYNPRIIEMTTGFAAEPERVGEAYTETFLRNLEDPSRVWEHAFSRQISEAARHLLLVLLSLPLPGRMYSTPWNCKARKTFFPAQLAFQMLAISLSASSYQLL